MSRTVSAPIRLAQAAQSVHRLDTVSAPICVMALLLHPSPLTWPALIVGIAPLVVRVLATGRPWRPTPFDVPIGLLGIGAVLGFLVALAPTNAAIRLTGLIAALLLFAWVQEHVTTPGALLRGAAVALALVAGGSVLMLHIAQPFLLLDRVPPLAWLAAALEPLGVYRLLVADEAALQRFRLYASGVGAVAAVGVAMAAGFVLAGRQRAERAVGTVALVYFLALLFVADNRGSMLAAAASIGCLVVWWQPKLRLAAVLLVFGTIDLIAVGLAQRGLNLRTVLERLDFWRNGLLLASDTPLTGVGLGVESVQLAYWAAFQPVYPAFSHTHSIYVQALVEQGIVGAVGLLLVCILVFRLGPTRLLPPPRAAKHLATSPATPLAAADSPATAPAVSLSHDDDQYQLRTASFMVVGGLVAFLVAGLTEIVALTTVGGVVLFGLLGLLAAAHAAQAALPVASPETANVCPASAAWWRRWLPVRTKNSAPGNPSATFAPSADALRTVLFFAVAGLIVVAGLVVGRSVVAAPMLNAGTTVLYHATLREGLNREQRATVAERALPFLRAAVAIDPDSVPARRNLALALAASGDQAAAVMVADEARARIDSTGAMRRDALYGVGRAYAAADAWDAAIDTWTEAQAGPQLLRVGRQLVQGPRWTTGAKALEAAAHVGAPGRAAQDAITRAALAHGESADQAVERLSRLVANGGPPGYYALLQQARVYRLAGRIDDSLAALEASPLIQRDIHYELERALLYAAREQWEISEPRLVLIAERPIEPAQSIPDGDDPHYWLALSQARRGKLAEAVATAQAGLRALPPEQASLRVPYAQLLGDSLLALGRPVEALAALEVGRRIAPNDTQLAASIARARAAPRP